MAASSARNLAIAQERKSGKSLGELAKTYGISPQRIGRICTDHALGTSHHPRKSTFSVKDFQLIRDLVARYTMRGVLIEIARIAANYGVTSRKYKKVATYIRLLTARELS